MKAVVLFSLAFFCEVSGFVRLPHNARPTQVAQRLFMSSPKPSGNGGPLAPTSGKVSELGSMLDKMPLDEKYALMIQSYTSSLLDNTKAKSVSAGEASAMDSIESLYIEMLSNAVRPTETTSRNLIDSAATFRNSAKLGRALQLGRASGGLRAFGAANGQLTTPITSAKIASSLYVTSPKLPTDDRQSEILCAAIATVTAFSFALLQLVSIFDSDAHPWATLLGVAALAAGGADVALTQGKNLKLAAAGFERLSLRDRERDAYTEGSAFLLGYLLGLPCFCFQPDISEALSLLRTCPGALDVYKQPVALAAKRAAGSTKSATGSASSKSGSGLIFGSAIGSSSSKKPASDSLASAKQIAETSQEEKSEANTRLLKQLLNVDDSQADLAGLGRLLIWLVAPVAAETLKYGKSVVSDPKRGERILDVLQNMQVAAKKESAAIASENSMALDNLGIPSSKEDKKALVQWAYNEAVTLIRQYGELLENTSDYICTGTASVGECALLIETEVR